MVYSDGKKLQQFTTLPQIDGNTEIPARNSGELGKTNLQAIQAFLSQSTQPASPTWTNTDQLTEGSNNLFFTTARARSAFSAGANITITNGVISATGAGGAVYSNLTNSDYISIRSRGAIGDANEATLTGTDNRAAIQQTINDAVSSGIRAVYVPPGVYGCIGGITLPAGIKLFGAGYSSCILMMTETLPAGQTGAEFSTHPNVITITGSFVTIEGLRVCGPSKGQVRLPQYSAGNGGGVGIYSPTTGTWAAGDFVRNSTPAIGQPTGWVCTAAGSPGTWRPLANLA